MVIRPRWHKVFADLWSNKTRSILVILSITVGLFAMGVIATMHALTVDDMRNGYMKTNPANIALTISSFDQDLVDYVREIDGVADVMGTRDMRLRIQANDGTWQTIKVTAYQDPAKRQINIPSVVSGSTNVIEHEIIIDQYKLPDLGKTVGDEVTLELPSGKKRQMKLTGVVKDQTIGAFGYGGGFFVAPLQGYIDDNDLAWLEQPQAYNILYITVADGNLDEDHIRQVAMKVKEDIEANGYIVSGTSINRSDQHPNSIYTDAIAQVLLVLGAMVLFLSGFLITNTLSALLTHQIQQIGIMKTLGARRGQVILIYLVLILIFSLIALAISLPLSQRAAYALLQFLSDQINFEVQGYRSAPQAILLQMALAILVPQFAGIIPILRGSQITVQQAISGISTSESRKRKGYNQSFVAHFRGLPRPLLLSLRNTFRRRIRLALTLITLILGGAVFIATFNVRGAIDYRIAQVGKYFLADVNLAFERPYRVEKVVRDLSSLDGVEFIETWQFAQGEIVYADGTSSDSVRLLAPPIDSRLVDPVVTRGRWLMAGDTNAITLNENFSSNFPDMKPGDTLRLKLQGEETDWVVVGFFQLAGKNGGYLGYVDYDYLSKILHTHGSSDTFRVAAAQEGLDLAHQRLLARSIETYLTGQGYRANDVTAGQTLQANTADGLNVLTTFLLIMALLTALVGSIGLMGTMSLNVMERTREIGILRAIGASDGAIFELVLVEGLIIGIISWVFGVIAAIPISQLMSNVIGYAVFESSMPFIFKPGGLLIWLGVVLLLSVVASLLPARNAARLTIREVLSYE